MKRKKFQAIYIKIQDKEAGYIEIPFDVEKEFGAKRVKVVAMLEEVEYRGSLVRMGTDCHILGIPKEIREKMGKSFGETISVELYEDKSERVVLLPEDFKKLLESNGNADAFFKKLSYTNQRKYVLWIDSAKKIETRNNRLQEAIGLLENGKIK